MGAAMAGLRYALVLCAVVLVCGVLTAPVTNVNPDAIVAEEAPALSLVGMRTAMKGLSPNKEALQNIQQLKGYCVAAYDKAKHALDNHNSAKKSALVNLIVEYGTGKASKELVVEYGQTMHKLREHFDNNCLPAYLLDHLDQAVLSGEGIILTTGGKARFDSEGLGFQEEPGYVEDLAVGMSDFTTAWTSGVDASSTADEQAAMECMQAGTLKKYSSFLDQIKAKYKAKAEEYWQQVVKGASSVEEEAYDATSNLDTQSPAGLGGAAAAIAAIEGQEGGIQMPSDEEMVAEVEKEASLKCPADSEQVGAINADISGCGLTSCGERYAIDTIEDCQKACKDDTDCSSFTWAPIGGDKNHGDKPVCTKYAQTEPSSTWGPNQIFCKMTDYSDLPDCKKSCCTIKIYKAPKPAEGRRRRRRKVQDWEEKKLEKTIKKCSYTGEAPEVDYTGKIKAFELSGQCEKVTLYDYDPKKIKKNQNNHKTYTSSQYKIAKDLRNDISGFKLYIKDKNKGKCNTP